MVNIYITLAIKKFFIELSGSNVFKIAYALTRWLLPDSLPMRNNVQTESQQTRAALQLLQH